MRLLALGGCGGMGRFAVRTALQDDLWDEIVVADLDGERAAAFADTDPRLRALRLDVTDEGALRAALREADVVLAAVGPYVRFGVPVLRAALETGTPYVDLCDDWQPTVDMLALPGDSVAVLGMGASPGISNLLAARAAAALDEVDELHTLWGIGQWGVIAGLRALIPGRGGSYGAATEHLVGQLAAPIRAVRDGALVDDTPLLRVELPWPGGPTLICHTVGHPEPVTLVRSHPSLKRSLNLMDLPAGVIALLAGAVAEVHAGRSVRDAAAALHTIERRPWKLVGSRAGLDLLLEMVRGADHLPGGVCAWARGRVGGEERTVGVCLRAEPEGGVGGLTGVPAGIVLGMVARGEVALAGVHPPEEAVDAELFFSHLARRCGVDDVLRVDVA